MLRRRLLGEKGESFKYITGSLACNGGEDFNNYYTGQANCGVHATVMLHDDTSWATIAKNKAGSNSRGWDLHFTSSDYYRILEFQEVNANGTANHQCWDFGSFVSNTWYTIDFFINNDSAYLSVNGSAYATFKASSPKKSAYTNVRNVYFGGENISFRDELSVWGTNYNSESTVYWAGWNIENSTVGSSLSLTSGIYTLTSDSIVQLGKE